MEKTLPSHIELNTPVLLLAFKRPETTRKVIEALSKSKPKKLYFSVDGPRVQVAGEIESVKQVRQLINEVDWPCQIRTRFLEHNQGGPIAVSGAISWFFENEPEGVILEDDTCPHPDFIHFAQELLGRYRLDQSVWTISGNNFQKGIQRGDGSYYFSKYFHCWGWATWRDRWEKFDVYLRFWPSLKESTTWRKIHSDPVERKYWENIFDARYAKPKKNWDYAWVASIWNNDGKNIIPNVNMVSNIGFGENASNCRDPKDPASNIPAFGMKVINPPRDENVNHSADQWTFDEHFQGKKLRFPLNLYHIPRNFVISLLRKVLTPQGFQILRSFSKR